MKKVLGVHSAPPGHWVGDGFPVRSLFSYNGPHNQHLTPFLLLDYAGPADFEPAMRRRGVGEHPHRGFETVTIVYQGGVAHRDSTGAGGLIGPGDVQWMTAASGIIHEEFHSDDFTMNGGTLEMVQLWVNLPAKAKMGPAGYQTLLDKDIPRVDLAGGSLRVIAGDYLGNKGPARTTTPMNVWDIRLGEGQTTTFPVQEGYTLALVVLKGDVVVNGETKAGGAQFVLLDRAGADVAIEAKTDATILLLSGEPIDEPVFGYGPFVMNNRDEIVRAIEDFNSGKFGRMAG
ncbi:MAG: pirin family protein [Rhodospirillaceae bacterium]